MYWKCCKTGQILQTDYIMCPLKGVPWLLWSSAGIFQVEIFPSSLHTAETVAVWHGNASTQ